MIPVVALWRCAAPSAKIPWDQDLTSQHLGAHSQNPWDSAPQHRQQQPAGHGLAKGGPQVPEVITILRPLPRVHLHPENSDFDEHEPKYHAAVPTALMLDWPLPTTGINSLFGDRADPIDGQRRFHLGIDLAADYGAPVKAAAPGFVLAAGWNGGHGRQIIVEHDGGFRSSYSHLSQVLVHRGANVQAGQAIGLVGSSGRSTGAHLHFEISRFGLHLDPLEVIGRIVAID